MDEWTNERFPLLFFHVNDLIKSLTPTLLNFGYLERNRKWHYYRLLLLSNLTACSKALSRVIRASWTNIHFCSLTKCTDHSTVEECACYKSQGQRTRMETTTDEKCQYPFRRWKVDGRGISDLANWRLLKPNSPWRPTRSHRAQESPRDQATRNLNSEGEMGAKIGRDAPNPLLSLQEEGKFIFWRNRPKRCQAQGHQAQQRVGLGRELETED